jgi:hypothetical protein
MEVLGFEGRGAQTRFAEEIGVARSRLNNVLIGQPLSRKLAEKIIRRYPSVSADFIFLGQSGGHLDRKLEKQLLDYQQKTGIYTHTYQKFGGWFPGRPQLMDTFVPDPRMEG